MAKPEKSEEFAAFDMAMRHILTVPKSELDALVQAHKAQAALNPNKRGPKPKVKPSDDARDAG